MHQAMSSFPESSRLRKFSTLKACRLLDLLEECKLCRDDFRAIVFVSERLMASALALLINEAGVSGIKAGYAVGSSVEISGLPILVKQVRLLQFQIR